MSDLAAPIVALVDSLRDAGVKADVDPANLNLPSVWVTPSTVAGQSLNGSDLMTLRLCLIVPDTDHLRALRALSDLRALVETVCTSDGLETFGTVLLPGESTQPMPCLFFPVNVSTL